jgi:hypothetical protein
LGKGPVYDELLFFWRSKGEKASFSTVHASNASDPAEFELGFHQ